MVAQYGHYFLGSIILSQRDSNVFIVDGQQRLTTLSLLLILLHLRQGDRADRVKLEELIYAEKYGTRTFNIAVPERSAAMESLFKGESPDTADASESVKNIVARFDDLLDLFNETEIDDKALPFFCDWLIDNVHMVEITAATDEDAYTIFETMNDWEQNIRCCQFQQRGDLQRLRPVSFPAAPATACFLRRASIH